MAGKLFGQYPLNNMRFFIILFLLLTFKFCYAQEFETKRESHQLIENRSIYLNGGVRASMGGKSRTIIKVDLPPNTVEWYYSFTTSKGKSGDKNLGLALQLSALLVDQSGVSSEFFSQIEVPEGVASADIYVCDRSNIDNFIKKESYNYNIKGSTENTRQAVVVINDVLSGSVYLGLKNPSEMNGLNISIEVVAITETQIAIPKTSEQQKAELYGSLGWTALESGDFQKCVAYCNKSSAFYQYGWIMANKGLAQLMQGNELNAVETYVVAIPLIKTQNKAQHFLKKVIKDLENAIVYCGELEGADQIKQMVLHTMNK